MAFTHMIPHFRNTDNIKSTAAIFVLCIIIFIYMHFRATMIVMHHDINLFFMHFRTGKYLSWHFRTWYRIPRYLLLLEILGLIVFEVFDISLSNIGIWVLCTWSCFCFPPLEIIGFNIFTDNYRDVSTLYLVCSVSNSFLFMDYFGEFYVCHFIHMCLWIIISIR